MMHGGVHSLLQEVDANITQENIKKLKGKARMLMAPR